MTLLYRHKFHFNLSGKPTDKFEIEAGAYFGVFVSYYYSSNSIVLANSADPSVSTYYTVKYNPYDVGLLVGFNYNFSNNFSLRSPVYQFRNISHHPYYKYILPLL